MVPETGINSPPFVYGLTAQVLWKNTGAITVPLPFLPSSLLLKKKLNSQCSTRYLAGIQQTLLSVPFHTGAIKKTVVSNTCAVSN